jgi:DNA processing protein
MKGGSQSELRDMLRLMMAPGVGPVKLARMLGELGSPAEALRADYHRLEELGVLSKEALLWLAGRQWDDRAIDSQIEAMQATGTTPLYRWQSEYPAYLCQIYDPPQMLFVRGNRESLNTPCFAIVGTREPSINGVNTTRDLASGIAGAGFTVVSGLARGIDSAAHEGALASGGTSVAVLGCGTDIIYPPENEKLAERICERGCLVSEYLMGTPPEAHNFPRRNRLISGLSRGVLVVEAGSKSGALLTASYAVEQNRDVFAVPGDPRKVLSEGVNTLIQQGAKLVKSLEDILSEMGELLAKAAPGGESSPEEKLKPALSAEERLVFEGLGREALHVDELAEKLGMDVSHLLGILLRLVMKQLVREHPGKLYSLG